MKGLGFRRQERNIDTIASKIFNTNLCLIPSFLFIVRKSFTHSMGVILIILITGCAGKSPRALPAVMLPSANVAVPSSQDHFLAGDSLELFVKEDPSFNGTYVVREGGYILIPRIGRIQIIGLDREGAERHITQTLQKGQLTKAHVFVEHVKSSRAPSLSGPEIPKIMVYLTGCVVKPGVHLLPLVKNKPMGLYEAILITGGLTRFGNHGKVEILRVDSTGKRVRSVVDIRPIREGKTDDPPLSEGDIINVSEKVFGF